MGMRKFSYTPPQKSRSSAFKFGEHFSKHVHGMFMYPKATIKRIVTEKVVLMDLGVPLAVIIAAGIMSAIGAFMWGIIATKSVLAAFGLSLVMTIAIIWFPISLILVWIGYSIVFHFIGSIVSGKDITNQDTIHKTFKLVGISFAPFFLNIFPFFGLFTGFWVWILCLWSMRENYRTSPNGSLIITLPMLFFTALGFLYAIIGLLR